MDAGVAALLGAVAGGLGAIGAGWISAWGTREQVRTQVRADLSRWHLQERQKVYTDFMRAGVAAGATLNGITTALEEFDSDAAEEKLRACKDRIADLTSTCALVILQGPRDVATQALELADKFESLLQLGKVWRNAIIANDQAEIDDASPEFKAAVRAVNSQATTFAESAHAILVREEASIEQP